MRLLPCNPCMIRHRQALQGAKWQMLASWETEGIAELILLGQVILEDGQWFPKHVCRRLARAAPGEVPGTPQELGTEQMEMGWLP